MPARSRRSKVEKSRGLPDTTPVNIPTVTAGASASAVAAFARHETFHPRYGWLKKGFDKTEQDPKVFLNDDAPVVLGVGKNMVRAIRYWCHATKLLEDVGGARGAGSAPTEFGRALVGPAGLDPYLEDLGSLWLLHWRLLSPPCMATAWHFAFSIFARPTFSHEELSTALAEYADREFPTARLATSSLKKDVSCIVRMYGEVESSADDVGEDSIQCPFAELRLLRAMGGKSFAFNMGTKPGLSPWLVGATALQFCARSNSNARTISLSTLLHAPGSPGMAFKLTEAALYGALESAATGTPGLALTDAGGSIQLSFNGDPTMIADALLQRHFDASRPRKAVA